MNVISNFIFFQIAALLCIASVRVVEGWDLTRLGLHKAHIVRVTLCGPRAFLNVIRTDAHQPFTLIEASWPERPRPFLSFVKPYPSSDPQNLGECKLPQTVVNSGWDGYRHLLALDTGWLSVCPPKILVYELLLNKNIASVELSGVPAHQLSSLVVDTSTHSPRAYIGMTELSSLLVFDLRSHQWWQVSLSWPYEVAGLTPLFFTQHTLAGSDLYMASNASDILIKVDVTPLRETSQPSRTPGNGEGATVLSVEVVGSLLGPSSGLVSDDQTLYYCLQRDYACVGWDTSLPLIAESHVVLMQSLELLPNVHQLFWDFYRQLWALTSYNNSTGVCCQRFGRYFPGVKLH